MFVADAPTCLQTLTTMRKPEHQTWMNFTVENQLQQLARFKKEIQFLTEKAVGPSKIVFIDYGKTGILLHEKYSRLYLNNIEFIIGLDASGIIY